MESNYTGIGSPHLHLAFESSNQFVHRSEELARQLPYYAIKLLRGAHMRTKGAVLLEFSAALNFPNYFGKNWDALEECIRDLDWLPAAGYIIFISQANEVLIEELALLPILLSVLHGAGEFWAAACDPKPFHAVFGCPPQLKDAMETRLATVQHDVGGIA